MSPKTKKIVYWIATVWLALGMVSTGVVQLLRIGEESEMVMRLGYPGYFLTLIGIWKILGAAVVLLPRLPLVKEWAYAGFFFVMSGAIVSHVVMGDRPAESFGPSLLLCLTTVSWLLRPSHRKLTLAYTNNENES